MGRPVPSPSQIAAINQAKALALAGATGAAQSIVGFQAAIVKYQDIDNFAKANFDYANNLVIRKYELERRYMDGQLVAAPITQTDLDNFVLTNNGRLWNGGLFEPIRIPEFDGLPLAPTNDEHETTLFGFQDIALDRLQNGLTGIVLISGATTATVLDALSTTLELDTGASPISLSVGNRFLVQNGSDSAIVEVTSFTQGGTCSIPVHTTEPACTLAMGTWTIGNAIIGITVLIPPQAPLPIGSGAGLNLFDGFNNTERTNKVPSNVWENGLMTSLLERLEDVFTRRLAVLGLELAAINSNENDDIAVTAATQVQTSINAVNGFLGINPITSIDISDVGITSVNTEKTTRQGQISTRITQIASEITAGNFYNIRYNEAANRVQLANGTMVQLSDLQKALAGATSAQGSATALAARYDNMLAP